MLKVWCSGIQYLGECYLYSASDQSPQFPEMYLTLEDQLLVLGRFPVYFTCWTRSWDIFYFFNQLFIVIPQRWSFRAKCFSDFVSVTVKPVHVIAFRVLYLLLVFFTEVVHILAKPFITINNRARSTIKKCLTPCFWHDKFELLGVVIIDLVKHNLIGDVFVVVMDTSLDNFVPNNLCFDKLHILFVFHIYQGGSAMWVCKTLRCCSLVLIDSIWVGRATIWINISWL